MIEARMIPIATYSKTVKLDGIEIPCYTKKELEDVYPDGNWTVLGETKKKNKKVIYAKLYLSDAIRSSELKLDKEGNEIPFDVCYSGLHNKILYKHAGYVPVNNGDSTYVALLKLRFASIFGVFLGLLLLAGLLFWILFGDGGIPILNPLPPVDKAATPIEGDGTAQNTDGGTSISVKYRLRATLSLSTGKIKIFFQNPSKSNQNAVLSLYVVSDDTETMIAESGMIRAGYELRELQFISDSISMKEGQYTGKFKLTYYDPKTKEKSFVQPEITDVTIIVTQ